MLHIFQRLVTILDVSKTGRKVPRPMPPSTLQVTKIWRLVLGLFEVKGCLKARLY
jgi:hypothetical protein